MESDLKWAIGIAVTVVMAFTGIVVTTFRVLAERISSHVKDLHEKVDDVKVRYVRRDDLDSHLTRIDKSLQETREEMRRNHDQVISLLTKQGRDQ